MQPPYNALRDVRVKKKTTLNSQSKVPRCVKDSAFPKGAIVIGIIAGIVASLAFAQQTVSLWVFQKEATSLSWFTLGVCLMGQALWIAYGVYVQDYIVMTFAIVSLIIYFALAGTKVRFKTQ
jgi:uncharacterized protein with PQ loop repeat